jgi:DNA-3-methyladenine glycosylase II
MYAGKPDTVGVPETHSALEGAWRCSGRAPLNRAGPPHGRAAHIHARDQGRPPSGDRVFDMARATVVLPVAPPFRLDLTVWALRRRSKNAVDRWDGGQYSRIIVADGDPVRLTVIQEADDVEPKLMVTVESTTPISERARNQAGLLVRQMLGLAVDLQPFYDLARDNTVIGPVVERFLGMRPPRFPSVFEGLINSIACQQVTLDLGIVLLNRLSERFGAHVVDQDAVLSAFPTPTDLADVPEESIRELGFSRQKTRAIKELSTHVADTTVDLSGLEGVANKEAIDYLSRIRGIGRWSAEYVLLRGLGRLDTFPGDDIGAQNNLQRLFRLPDKPTYDHIRQLTSPWHPYEGVVYFHLLLAKLRANGVI